MDYWSTKKNYKFSKNIEKTPFRRVSQKRYNFAPGATIITLFFDPAYIYIYSPNLNDPEECKFINGLKVVIDLRNSLRHSAFI